MIYLVTGLPRSGTSMLMQCLEAGGLPVVRSAERDRHNADCADATYRPNPRGLYEPSLESMRFPGWACEHDGKGLKVSFPFLGWLSVHEYSAVVMRRDFEEVRQSWRAAFAESVPLERIAATFDEGMRTLRNRRDVRIAATLDYVDVLERPQLLTSLGWPIDVAGAASAVDAKHYRFRKERLVAGL